MFTASEPASLWVGLLVLALVALQRLAELWLAKRNTGRLLARGGIETGAGHYPLFVVLHSAWLAALAAWLLLGQPEINWPLLGLFVVLQAGRAWVIRTLGPYWTTRIIVVPGQPRIRHGPYRFTRHPNYLVVTLEIAVLPLALGAPLVALAFTILNALLLAYRIRLEEAALRRLAGPGLAR